MSSIFVRVRWGKRQPECTNYNLQNYAGENTCSLKWNRTVKSCVSRPFCCKCEQNRHSFRQDAGHAECKGDAKRRVSQHAGPPRGPADESEGTKEAQSQREKKEEAQLRVTGFDKRCVTEPKKDAKH